MARLKGRSGSTGEPDGAKPRGAKPPLKNARAMSAGGIVIRRGDHGPELVIGRRRRERTWTLPKGTPNAGEAVEQTATREVTEETGLHVTIVERIGAIEYWFVLNGTRYHKVVHYFLMEPTGGDLADHDREFDEVKWVELGAADSILSFPTERDIVHRASDAIAKLTSTDH